MYNATTDIPYYLRLKAYSKYSYHVTLSLHLSQSQFNILELENSIKFYLRINAFSYHRFLRFSFYHVTDDSMVK